MYIVNKYEVINEQDISNANALYESTFLVNVSNLSHHVLLSLSCIIIESI
jgi:hypothetical protein